MNKSNFIILTLISSLSLLSVAATAAKAKAAARSVASAPLSQGERQGFEALKDLGFDPETFDRRSLREAGLLKVYQSAWNDFDTSVTDPLKIANPDKIVAHYTEGPGLLYRDMCVPNGLTSKANLKKYLTMLYSKFPRQVWGDGWKTIHLFKSATPGEWSYYYDFAMYPTMASGEKATYTGTGMERVKFDSSGKLISDEVHLILNSGVANCGFGPG